MRLGFLRHNFFGAHISAALLLTISSPLPKLTFTALELGMASLSSVLQSLTNSRLCFPRIHNEFPPPPRSLQGRYFSSSPVSTNVATKLSSFGSNSFLKGSAFSARGLPSIPPSSKLTIRCQAGRNNNSDTVEAAQRVLSAMTYFVPLLDGIRFGRFLFQQYPVTRLVLVPLQPLLEIYSGVPFVSFVVFFGLYLGVIQNQNFSRYVRYNAMQAVVLDILMILPSLVERIFAPSAGIGREFLILLYNTVFIFLLACFLFAVISCLLGKTPRLPIVADAADAQVPY